MMPNTNWFQIKSAWLSVRWCSYKDIIGLKRFLLPSLVKQSYLVLASLQQRYEILLLYFNLNYRNVSEYRQFSNAVFGRTTLLSSWRTNAWNTIALLMVIWIKTQMLKVNRRIHLQTNPKTPPPSIFKIRHDGLLTMRFSHEWFVYHLIWRFIGIGRKLTQRTSE